MTPVNRSDLTQKVIKKAGISSGFFYAVNELFNHRDLHYFRASVE